MKTRSPVPSRPTVHDVARTAGVSIGTISRVVNRHPSVAPEVRKRVLDVIAQLGWRPNPVAQSMRTSVTRTVGCVFPDIRNPLYAALLKAAEQSLSAHGYTLMVANSDNEPAREAALVELFLQRRADGLFLTVADESAKEVIDAVAGANIPIVLLGRDLSLELCAVNADHYGGIRRATEYLISLGHRHIALITGGLRNRVGRERLRGFSDAFQRAGLEIDPVLLRLDSLESAYGYRETQALLGLAEPPTAIVAGGNQMLAGVLRGVRMKGIAIPDDVSIISSGDTELAELATPPITVLRWDPEAFGREAASMMLDLLQNRKIQEPRRIDLPVEIVLRRSCAPPRR